ncbi:MAG: 2-phospho-L-lactate transferase [Gammaproteobacteria bacterium]
MSGPGAGSVVALSGGVGGAKLAFGLDRILPAGRLTVIANTGDDFEHLGLSISPDIDTLVYTLGGLANPETGWGRAGETWTFMRALAALGGERWFNLGDGDLAMHLERTRRLAAGERLGAVTAAIAARLGVRSRIVPMSDDPVRTHIHTPAGVLMLQHWFVRERCEPEVLAVEIRGAGDARPHPDALAALAAADLRAVVICPSNPFISIEPILALPGLRAALVACDAPVVAVSPIVGGEAVKGPTAKMLRDTVGASSAAAVAARYGSLLTGYVLDRRDAGDAAAIDVAVKMTDTLMTTPAARERLAAEVLGFADGLRAGGRRA